MKAITQTLLCLTAIVGYGAAEGRTTDPTKLIPSEKEEIRTEIAPRPEADSTEYPKIKKTTVEIGKGVTFRSKENGFKLSVGVRMQNLLAFEFNRRFDLRQTDARVRRARVKLDGHIYSPKFAYTLQLGFSESDTEPLPNGNSNIVRDAILYYRPNETWQVGFGQAKIKANRAQINSSGALQFVDRSIVNSQFNIDQDFGLFGEVRIRKGPGWNIAAKASITSGEGRNWGISPNGGFAYTGRVEVYPLGRFENKGEASEGDAVGEESPKVMVAAAYSFNDNAIRTSGQRGGIIPNDGTRDIRSYFIDFILKYRGFAFYADFMGRNVGKPTLDPAQGAYIYDGCGVNIQSSYLFRRKWEVAIRNSTLFPDDTTKRFVGYGAWNQTSAALTRYIIGHRLKIQADVSYNYRSEAPADSYNPWVVRFQLEVGI